MSSGDSVGSYQREDVQENVRDVQENVRDVQENVRDVQENVRDVQENVRDVQENVRDDVREEEEEEGESDLESIQLDKVLVGEKEAVDAGRMPTTSVKGTFFNLLKSYMGSGVLGLPFAFYRGGLLTSTVIMCVVGVIATHTMFLLVSSKQACKDPKVQTFSDVGRAALGRGGGYAITAMLLFTQYGFCCVYVVFLSQTSKFLLEQAVTVLQQSHCERAMDAPGFIEHALCGELIWRVFVLLWMPVLIASANIRTLKNLAPLTMLANFFIMAGVFLTAVASLWRFIGLLADGKDLGINYWIDIRGAPVTFGMAVYAFEGIGVVIPCETAMKRKEKFPPVIMSTMVIATIIYVSFGMIGYLGFGDTIQGEGIVSFNMYEWAADLDPLPLRIVWIAMAIISFLLLIYAIFATYPLQLFVVTDIILEWLHPLLRNRSNRFHTITSTVLRCLLVISTGIVAVSIPDFGLLMGLVGALGGTTLQFIFPALIYLRLFWRTSRWPIRILCIFYVIFGATGCFIGTSLAFFNIVEKFIISPIEG